MWYFTWILGINVAVLLAIVNVLWLESNYAFGQRDEEQTRRSFERASDNGAAS